MLPLAVGVAISPVPIIAVILMLISARAKANGSAFVGGWVVGIGSVVAVALRWQCIGRQHESRRQ